MGKIIRPTRCLFMGKNIRSTRFYLWVKIYVPLGVYLWVKLYVAILIFICKRKPFISHKLPIILPPTRTYYLTYNVTFRQLVSGCLG